MYVSSEVIGGEAAASEVNQLNFTAREASDNNIFRLDIAVNELQRVNELERLQHLLHDPLEPRHCVIRIVIAFFYEAAELVEILLQQLGHDEQVLLAVEEVDEPQHVVLVGVASRVDILQQLDLVQRLVEEVLVVLDHLQTDPLSLVLLGGQVDALQCRGEGRLSQQVRHLIAAGYDSSLGMLQILRLLEASLVWFKNNFQIKKAVRSVRSLKLLLSNDFRP